jgi:hypothetical protein
MIVTYTYPGDPALKAEFTYGRAFMHANPNREVVVTAGDTVSRFPINDVVCDSCNEEVGPLDPCVIALSRLYCWTCAQKWVLPYVDAAEGRV